MNKCPFTILTDDWNSPIFSILSGFERVDTTFSAELFGHIAVFSKNLALLETKYRFNKNSSFFLV